MKYCNDVFIRQYYNTFTTNKGLIITPGCRGRIPLPCNTTLHLVSGYLSQVPPLMLKGYLAKDAPYEYLSQVRVLIGTTKSGPYIAHK